MTHGSLSLIVGIRVVHSFSFLRGRVAFGDLFGLFGGGARVWFLKKEGCLCRVVGECAGR